MHTGPVTSKVSPVTTSTSWAVACTGEGLRVLAMLEATLATPSAAPVAAAPPTPAIASRVMVLGTGMGCAGSGIEGAKGSTGALARFEATPAAAAPAAPAAPAGTASTSGSGRMAGRATFAGAGMPWSARGC